jgi:hypothetical protein
MLNKDRQIRFRVSTAEHAALQAVARAERRKLSETLRELIREGAQRRGLWPARAHPGTNGGKRDV